MRSAAGLILSLVVTLCACGGGQESERTEEARTETARTETTEMKHDGEAAKGAAAAGKKIFLAQGCGNCHTFKRAGTTGTAGPNLDETLRGHHATPAHVREAIVEPNAEIARGFEPNVMPQDYGEKLNHEQVDALVAFLTKGKHKKHG